MEHLLIAHYLLNLHKGTKIHFEKTYMHLSQQVQIEFHLFSDSAITSNAKTFIFTSINHAQIWKKEMKI